MASTSRASADKAEVQERFAQNVKRVKSVISLYPQSGSGRREVSASDLLRAAVVLLHASFEDFLREVVLLRVAHATNKWLAQVPLTGNREAPTKFDLGDLSAHRSKSIDAVIEESIRGHLEKSTYNNTMQVAGLLEGVGIEPKKVNAAFSKVDAMMKRRHRIVHRADRNESTGSGHYKANSLAKPDVENWIRAVESTVDAICKEI
jgi:hypothetical protein